MDFFEHQEQARRRTGLLVVGYAAAVLMTITAVYAVLVVLLRDEEGIAWWQAEIFLGVALLLGLLILGGSLFKISALSAGGAKVASMLGAREVSPDTTDPDERRLLNVVEEMAIASGVSTPSVYVIDENGINAFAAGFRTSDAVIGVTKGCLQQLSRDELQGVIAHEYSHIINGDMRLNIRLIGVLHGLLMIHLLGMIMLRMMVFSGGGRHRRRSSSSRGGGDGKAAIVMFVLGLAMTIIGLIGVLFGRIIKSAVSRQREHLADAAAVQFTRNPAGLAGALKKIGGLSDGSRVRDPHAEELSHLFFANGLATSWLGLMASHPPLKERIRRLDPAFAGQAGSAATASAAASRHVTAQAAADDMTAGAMGLAGKSETTATTATTTHRPSRDIAMRPEQITASIGTLTAGRLEAARNMLSALPAALRQRLHDTDDAAAAVLALLSSDKPEAAAIQLKILEKAGDEWPSRVDEMKKGLKGLDSSLRLAVVDLALPALHQLTPQRYQQFRQWCLDFVAADKQVSVFEYALLGIIERHLTARFTKTKKTVVQYYALKPLIPDAVVLLGVLARFGNENDHDQAAEVFAAGIKKLDPTLNVSLPSETECTLSAFDHALNRWRQAAMPLRQRLLQAGAVCVTANNRVTVDEGNLLRAVADAFDVPMPPLIADDSM